MIGAAALLAVLLPLQAAAQAPDRITLYCGGGVSGGGGGAIAQGDGTLIRTSRASATAPVMEEALPGRMAPTARWHALLDAARFETLQSGPRGANTCSLSRRRGGSAHGLGWRGPGVPAEMPAALRQVVEEMQAAVRD